MSNVKVNGNTYNDVTSVKLMKADGSGYAEYREDAEVADSLFDKLIANAALGDIEGDDASPCLGFLGGNTFGTVSFPYATSLKGGFSSYIAENVLLPNVSTIAATPAGNNSWRGYGFDYCKVTGTLDLSKLATVQNNATKFTYSKIGTLKLGSYAPTANIWIGSEVTNFVWYGATADFFNNDTARTYFSNMTITNLYVPAAVKDVVQGYMDSGKLSKITNVYSIDDWED